MQHRDLVGDGAHARHVVGDGHRRRAHLRHDLADQVVDDAGHDRVEAGGRLVEEDDLGLRGDGTGQAARASACRPTAPPGNWSATSGVRPTAAQLLDGDGARLARGRSPCRASAGRRRSPRRAGVEQRRRPGTASRTRARNASRSRARTACAVDADRAPHRADDAQDALQQHRLAGARAADDDQCSAPVRRDQVDPAQDLLGPKALSGTFFDASVMTRRTPPSGGSCWPGSAPRRRPPPTSSSRVPRPARRGAEL